MKSKRTITREARLHSIAAFYNQAGRFTEACREKSRIQRVRTFSQEYHSDLQFVLRLLAGMCDTGVVIHGPRGCFSLLPQDIGKLEGNSHWMVTDLNERDVILGGEAKLRGTIRRMFEENHPSRLYVVTTPPVSVNNDDTEALAGELEEEYGVPAVVIPATGFRSKLGVMGYDEAQDALSLLIPPAKNKGEPSYVNLISVSESPRDVAEAGRFLNDLGLAVNVLPNLAGEHQLAHASGAKLSLVLNPEEGGPLAAFLDARFGVPAFTPLPPVGFAASDHWKQSVAARLGMPFSVTESADELLEEDCLNGLNVYLMLDAWYVVPFKMLFESLGACICGVTVPFLDEGSHAVEALSAPNAPLLHVAQGQAFELVKIWERTAPDVVICQHTLPRAPLSGTPCVSLEHTGLFGHDAARRLLQAVVAAQTYSGFFRTLCDSTVYRRGWMQKRVDWHIKLEVS
ncbi:MAG: nitrogenase component 1 [Ethanoligenens sp.]